MSLALRDLYFLKAFGYSFYEPPAKHASPQYSCVEALYKQIAQCELCALCHHKPAFYADKLGQARLERLKLMLVAYSHSPHMEIIKELVASALALSFDELEIAFVLRCPAPRGFMDSQAQLCKPYLQDEILLRSPKAVLVLGDLACKALLGTSLEGARSGVFNLFGAKAVASFEPAFLAKNPSKQAEFMTDLDKIRRFL